MTSLSSEKFLDLGQERYENVSSERTSGNRPNHQTEYSIARGTWEAAAVIRTSNTFPRANDTFLRSIKDILFNFDGPMIWSFERAKKCDYDPPRVYSNTWENFAVNHCDATKQRYEYFNIYDPSGKFYHMRSADDDLYLGQESGERCDGFDIHLPFVHCVQAANMILEISKVYEPQEGKCIEFSFRWKGLSNRKLASWLCEESYFSMDKKAYQDEITVSFSIDSEVDSSNLHAMVLDNLLPVYNLFEGFEPNWDRVNIAIEKYFKG